MKKETLEEAAEKYANKYAAGESYERDVEEAVKFGAKWQQERMYSEEEVLDIVYKIYEEFNIYISKETALIKLQNN